MSRINKGYEIGTIYSDGKFCWGCVYCRDAGTPFTVSRNLDGYYQMCEHFTTVHPGQVRHGNKILGEEK